MKELAIVDGMYVCREKPRKIDIEKLPKDIKIEDLVAVSEAMGVRIDIDMTKKTK